jgi:Domain of unknown function (DUF5655)
MARWTCPECDREFGRAHQAHFCVPGGTVDETFAGRPGYQRAVYDALVGHLRSLGPVHEDAVKVGVFLLRERKFAEVRPMARSVSLALVLPHGLAGPRVARALPVSGGRVWNVVKLTGVDDVDDEVLDWLTEAYHLAG